MSPIRVRLMVMTEIVGSEVEEVWEIPREDWDAMSSDQREEYLEEMLSDFRDNKVESNYEVLNE